MWSAGNLMRDVCLPKYPKVSKEIADNIRNGNIPNSKDSNCYINCILEMMQSVSTDSLKSLEQSPEKLSFLFNLI